MLNQLRIYMYYTKQFLFFIIVLVCSLNIQAQDYFSSIGEHQIAVNHKTNNSYSYNFSLATRHFIYNKSNYYIKIRQVDFKHFSTYNLNLNSSLSFGLHYRNKDWFENTPNELRLTQQYNYKNRKGELRFGHRFRTEQRITQPKTIHRFRYRLALDFPLKGKQLDIGETYFVASNEVLYSLAKVDKPELDYRITTQLGFLATKNLKLQFGLEYRFEALNLERDQKLHILTSAVIRI